MFNEVIFCSRKYDDHKIFREPETGRISIADWSGYRPEDTEDGPLLVDEQAHGEVGMYRGRLLFNIPVWCLRTQSDGRVSTSFDTMCALMKVRPAIRWKPTPEVIMLIGQLHTLDTQCWLEPGTINQASDPQLGNLVERKAV